MSLHAKRIVLPLGAHKILDRRCGELDARHALQLIEADHLASPRLAQPHLCPLVSAANPVEQLDDVPRIGIGFVKGMREQ